MIQLYLLGSVFYILDVNLFVLCIFLFLNDFCRASVYVIGSIRGVDSMEKVLSLFDNV